MTTAIKTGDVRLLFMTVPSDTGIDINLSLADENFMPIGKPSYSMMPQDEISYHTELRQKATEVGEFVKEFSTNPELNPGYIAEVEDENVADV